MPATPFPPSVVLPVGGSDTIDLVACGGEGFLVFQPDEDGSWHFDIDLLSGSDGPYMDVYLLTEGSLGAFSYDEWIGWVGDHFDDFVDHEEGTIEMFAGETYVLAFYNQAFTASGSIEVTASSGQIGPANDRVINAEEITETGPEVVITGSTTGGSTEFGEFDTWDGNQSPSLWYHITLQGPGYFSYQIESTTPGFHPAIEIFYNPGGPVNGFSDLQFDSGEEAGDGTENPPAQQYDQTGTPPGQTGDLTPLEAGDEIWIRVMGYDEGGDLTNQYSHGGFTMTLGIPGESHCFSADALINPSSPTATVVGGAVRETQRMDGTVVDPFEGRSDMVATLLFSGDDILAADGGADMGFYNVSVKSKLNTDGFFIGMFKRNGQPLQPGGIFDSTSGGTPVLDWMTAPAGANLQGADRPTSLNMVWALPVRAGDEFEFIVGNQSNFGTPTIDITQICFSRAQDAIVAPAYDLLDIPDYPLGTSAADMADTNPEQAGDLTILKSTAPIHHEHDIWGHDMVVTNDGVIWVLAFQAAFPSAGGATRFIGPYLMKWDPGSPGWTTVNNDIEGYGVKRTTQGGVASSATPYRVSMDTDGTDLWMCWGIDDGAFVGGGRKSKIRVKKYTVSSGTFSNVGSPFCGPDHGSGGTLNGELSQIPGDFNECATVRIDGSGNPWVGFTDQARWSGDPTATEYYFLKAYVAQFTGGSWVIHELVAPDYKPPTINTYEAETYIGGSGTASVVVEDGQTAVRETQTSAAATSISMVPPAGAWVARCRVEYNRAAGTGGIAGKWYKNGVAITAMANDFSTQTATNPTWFWFGMNMTNGGYATFNGTSDTLELRMWRIGTATEVFCDKIRLCDAESFIQQFDYNARYVDDGQPMVALWGRQPSDPPGMGNPSALVVWDINRPELTDTDSEYYIPPMEPVINYAITDFRNAYYEWNGSSFPLIWDKLTEEDVPDHVFLNTLDDNVASTPPYGHFQQGMGFCSGPLNAETDNYLVLCTGGGQAFGFFGDAIICVKVTSEGLEAFTPVSPTVVQGAGYPSGFVLGLAGFSGWAWDVGARCVHVDVNDNVWLHWSGSGPEVDSFLFVATAYKGNAEGDNGLGGWFAAAETNDQMGYDPIEDASGRVYSSPDGSKVYLLMDPYLYDDWVIGSNVPGTFGVWACDVIEDAKIPLSPVNDLEGEVNMNIRTSKRANVTRLNQ